MFGLWQFLSGSRNPTRHWHADPARAITLDLDEHRLCGVGIGELMQTLAFLGPAASWSYEWEFPHLGITLLEADHGLAEFAVYFGRPTAFTRTSRQFRPFSGSIAYRGTSLELSAEHDESSVRSLFGEPYWRDADEEETILFYEFASRAGEREWQIEFDAAGLLRCLSIGKPLLADPEQRVAYQVTKDWPPK
jgi:hypothetical protein